MLVEIGLCGTAAFLFGRGLYHWIVQGLRQQPSAPPAAAIQTVAPWTDEDAKREAQLFLATGETCWWLDPNRWGDNPNWRDDMPRDDYLAREHRWIADKPFGGVVAIVPPPTRAETVKAAWDGVRLHWPRRQIDGRLIVADELGIIEPILFEQVRYGGGWVIEAEGVVVERLPAR